MVKKWLTSGGCADTGTSTGRKDWEGGIRMGHWAKDCPSLVVGDFLYATSSGKTLGAGMPQGRGESVNV